MKSHTFSQNEAIQEGYNQSCREYAAGYLEELKGKPLDRLLLRRLAEENKDQGLMIDLGCGPGQTSIFLRKAGVRELLGIDLSAGMIEVAREVCDGTIEYEVGDMMQLRFEDGQIGSAIAFYAIVHFKKQELAAAFQEIHRVLRQGGQFLFSFHIGQEINTVDQFLGKNVRMDFYFFEVAYVLSQLEMLGFKRVEVIERYPYEDKEYPSRRAYILVEKK